MSSQSFALHSTLPVQILHLFPWKGQKWYLIVPFIWISLLTNEAERLFIYLLVIAIYFYVNCLFTSFLLECL